MDHPFFTNFNKEKNEAISKGICLQCQELALPKCYSELGIKEYYISGTCEKCFDEMFKEVDEE